MFLGEYAHALDTKGRLTIPVRFRPELERGLVLTRGYEPCVMIYPLDQWQALASKVAQLPMSSQAARAYSRLVFGGAFEATLDKMGRFVIPPILRTYAEIGDEAVVVGVNTCLELWNPLHWRQALERDSQNLEVILSDLSRLGV